MPEPYLRRANSDDVDLLFRWVNDDTARENAFNTKKIEYNDHVKWFSERLCADNCVIYIYCDENGNPVGQCRIDIDCDCGVVSYSIDSEYRRRGHGKRLLTLLEITVITDLPHINSLAGFVKSTNAASQHIFRQLGYMQIKTDDRFEYRKELFGDSDLNVRRESE